MIKDFKCTYNNSVGISDEITVELDFKFPDAYKHADTMAQISKKIKEHEGTAFCELPFCHTVEGEAMGGIINYGDARTGPRAKKYICNSVEEVLELPEIDFESGRIHEVLLACKFLRDQGEHVVLDISGPFTILNVLIDAGYVFKAMRKKPEIMKAVFWKLGEEILKYMKEAQKLGVDLISYADSSGGVNILGPKMTAQVVEEFTYDFLKKVEAELEDTTLILLCPKTTLALLGTEKAELWDMPLSGPVSYGEACTMMIGKIRFAGQNCIKNVSYRLENGIFKAVQLK